MFERYTEAARRALFFARDEAEHAGAAFVEGEHLLLALIRETGGTVGRLLSRASMSPEAVRKDIDRLGRPQEGPPPAEIQFGPETKRILHLAREEADRLLHYNIDTEHLLLGILREDRSVAASVLTSHGMRINEVRDEIVLIHTQQSAPPYPGLTPRDMTRFYFKPPDLPKAAGVHISPTKKKLNGGAENSGDDYWALEGFQLKAVLSRAFGSHSSLFPETRIELPSSLDPRARYDLYLVLAPAERHEDRNRLMQQGIERHFHVTITREGRPIDVYVLTAPGGRTAAIRDSPQSDQDGVGFSGFSVEFALPDGEPPTLESFQNRDPTPEAMRNAIVSAGLIGGISISNGTMEEFCQALEQGLDRPIVDETELGGRYDIELRGGHTTTDKFLERLRTELGLQLTPARREVTMLVVRNT